MMDPMTPTKSTDRRITDGKSKPDAKESSLAPLARKVIEVLTNLHEKRGPGESQPKLVRVHLILGETAFFHEELKKQLEAKHEVDEGLANATSRVAVIYYCAVYYSKLCVEVHEHGPLTAAHRYLILESVEPAIDIVAL